ncbi:HK97-gp10 family putative phage morphogenesis protein [Streptomyces sp. H27-H5]|uniref:HK97-gp10 family putative phage morphogenesis protein n=1 Tax=Streptomyces sp. H27-H5 TaxID=2996460 RepID=UPI0022711547|nr:HK97-gp10 family putative phage morphogenesis protein [Streptomyces sp. H27-H5]MCY0961572.1 HK97 gp10 family phage protein [Streptomyces sp. H27-H5]
MAVTVRVVGLERLAQRLDELPEEIKQALVRAVKESAESVKKDVQSTVRLDTGNLREKVDITYKDGGLTAVIGWNDADTARYAVVHEFGNRRISARPALGPALEIERTRIEARIRDEVRRAVR